MQTSARLDVMTMASIKLVDYFIQEIQYGAILFVSLTCQLFRDLIGLSVNCICRSNHIFQSLFAPTHTNVYLL